MSDWSDRRCNCNKSISETDFFQTGINQFPKQTFFKHQLKLNKNAENFGNCCFAGGCCKISPSRQWCGPKPIQNAAAAYEERHGNMSGIRWRMQSSWRIHMWSWRLLWTTKLLWRFGMQVQERKDRSLRKELLGLWQQMHQGWRPLHQGWRRLPRYVADMWKLLLQRPDMLLKCMQVKMGPLFQKNET